MSAAAVAPRRAWLRTALCLLLLTECFLRPARAAEPPPVAPLRDAPAKKMVVGGYVVVRSFDALQELAGQVGVPLPPPLTVAGIEQSPFIGPGGLDADRPAGAAVLVGPGVSEGTNAALLLPVKQGRATLKSFTDQGARRVAGSKDAVTLRGQVFRRTDQYLLFGPTADGIAGLDPATIAARFKDPKSLARFVVDVKAIRTAAPQQFEDFFESSMDSAGLTAAEQAGEQWANDFMKNLDGVAVAVDRETAGLLLKATIWPMRLPPPTPGVMRPGMPAGVAVRYDLACPPTEALPVLRRESLQTLIDQSDDDAPDDVCEMEPMGEVWSREIQVIVGADAMSVGFQPGAGDGAGARQWVVYVVNQYAKPPDVVKELRDLAGQLGAVEKEDDDELPPLASSTYMSGGMSVERVTLQEEGEKPAYMDVVQKDRTVFITISPSPRSTIGTLVAAKPEAARAAGVIAGWVDAGMLADAFAKSPQNPLALMPPKQAQRVRGLLRNQRITLGGLADGDGLALTVSVPAGLLKGVRQMQGGGDAEPEAETAEPAGTAKQ